MAVIPAHAESRWHYVYLLRSRATDKFYIGCTNNLRRRLEEHSRGKSVTTKRMRPLELIYFEGFRSADDAWRREKHLKYFGSTMARLKSRLKGTLTAWAG
ncbi:MAG: GIY-YIG nuclease family protein [Nitrospirae bacterium]|nr:GIY-YIG nuclease family protein [Nitrospirota bacterium]